MQNLFLTSFGFVVVLIIIFGGWMSFARNNAQEAYQESLRRLRENPSDQALRQQTLTLGRAYSWYTRNIRGAYFDENAIKNDMDLALNEVARPIPTPSSPVQEILLPGPLSPADRLRHLDDLWSQGLLSEEEFREHRSRILNEI